MDLTSVSGLNHNVQVEWPFTGSYCKDIVLRESLLPFRDAFRAQGRTVRDRVYGWRIIFWFRRIRWIRFRALIYKQGCKMILGSQWGRTIHLLSDVKPNSTVVSPCATSSTSSDQSVSVVQTSIAASSCWMKSECSSAIMVQMSKASGQLGLLSSHTYSILWDLGLISKLHQCPSHCTNISNHSLINTGPWTTKKPWDMGQQTQLKQN